MLFKKSKNLPTANTTENGDFCFHHNFVVPNITSTRIDDFIPPNKFQIAPVVFFLGELVN